MSKEKEFKKICENWGSWINEQAPRRAGDYVDPDDPTSGYIRTKKGVERIASIPRPDDELAIPGMNPEAEKELEKKIVKKQTKRGMEYFKSEDEFNSYANIFAETWNGSPAHAFFFKIPGQKGARNYTWGNLAVDLAILAAGFIPATHALGVVARAGNKIKKAVAAQALNNPKARALAFTTIMQLPTVAKKLTGKLATGVGKAATDFVVGSAVTEKPKQIFHNVVSSLESGKKMEFPVSARHIAAMMNLAKGKGVLDRLMQDKKFTQAAIDAGVISKKG